MSPVTAQIPRLADIDLRTPAEARADHERYHAAAVEHILSGCDACQGGWCPVYSRLDRAADRAAERGWGGSASWS